MKIVFESELMENRKHAEVMAPGLAFEVLKSQDGDALFFSIGTDNVFYLTREATLTSTGWNKLDLSSTLSSQHVGAAVAAKMFGVAQNAQTLGIDLALVLTVSGADFLYLSLGNANTDAAWANGVTWSVIPFDAGTAPNPLIIADVFLMNISAVGGTVAVENIFVDILRTPGDPLKLLDRYYIKSGGSPQWNLHKLAADLAAGSISSCLGQRTNDPIPGIYTFGTINNEQELLFTPQYNYFNQADAPSSAHLALPAGASAIAAGDFFEWVKQSYDDVDHFVVQEAEGLHHFLATIKGKVYDVLLDCIDAVAHAVEFVFNRIKVFFEDLIKWLGFLFEWSDILRTHSVLKNVFNQYLAKCVNNLTDVRAHLQSTFTDVENKVDTWAGIQNNIPPSLSGTTLSSAARSCDPAPGQNSPQSNWGLHHLKSNAASGTTTAQPNPGVVGGIVSVLEPLVEALEREKSVFQVACDSFKSDIVDVTDISLAHIVKEVISIIANGLLESVENVLMAAVDVLIVLTEGIMDSLNSTIDIPVISGLYKKLVGDDLSLLDLPCLIAAIPATIGYKLIADAPPFPDNATTTALIDAPDFASIQNICNPVDASPEEVAETPAVAASISPSNNDILVFVSGILSAVGAVSVSVFSPLKQKYPASRLFPVVNALSYPLYVAPDIIGQIPDLQNKKWWAVLNEIITDVMTLKSIVDMSVALTEKGSPAQESWNPASPWLDFVGNIVWQVPTTAAFFDPENQNFIGGLNFLGGTYFDCNGIMSPALADDSDPITWGGLVAIATGLNLIYGTMSCAASVLTFKS